MDDNKKTSILYHLEEIRRRLLWSAIAVLVTTTMSFFFANRIFSFLTSRIPPDITLIFTEPTELMGVYMKVSIAVGFVLALPFCLYQFIMFINPALTPREKGYMYTLLPGIIAFFAIGAAFAYLVLLPPALDFLLNFPLLPGVASPQIRIGSYVTLVVKLVFWIGLLFEIPIVAFFLAKIGVLAPETLPRYWKHAIVGSFIVAAMVTPTFDPVNQALVAVPIMLLYGLSIVLVKVARRQPGRETSLASAAKER